MTIVEKIQNELKAFEEKKKVLVEHLRKEFPTMFKELFDKYPKIESVTWSQYTPYFNDGDECTFSVHADNLIINGEHEYDCDELKHTIYKTITEENHTFHQEFNKASSYYLKRKIGEYGNFPNPNFNVDFSNGVKAFKEILNAIPDEFMKDLFGDHAQITLTKEGIEVDGCEHE